jgi:hypothetical protein
MCDESTLCYTITTASRTQYQTCVAPHAKCTLHKCTAQHRCRCDISDSRTSMYAYSVSCTVHDTCTNSYCALARSTTHQKRFTACYIGDATWDKPAEFVPVVRENPYASTAETDFVKSVLSPKRSKGACSFKQHLNRTSTRAGAGAASAYRLQTMSEDGATAIEALDKSIAEKGRVASDETAGNVTANRTSLKFKTTLPSTAASP